MFSVNSARFCSFEHREEGIKLKFRELDRLDDLLNKILLLNTKALHGYRTFRDEQTVSGLLVLHQERYDRPLALSYPLVSQDIEGIGFCYNSCLHALQTLASVLAYFAERSFSVEEAHLQGVTPSQHILFLEYSLDHGTAHIQPRGLARWHSMFKLSSPFWEVYLDPTAPQYGRPQRWQHCSEYTHNYHHVPQRSWRRLGPLHSQFGTAYKEAQEDLVASMNAQDELAALHNMQMYQNATRHINNVVFSVVEHAGGPQMIRHAGEQTWERILDDILKGVEDQMETLRADVDQVMYRFSDELQRDETYWTLLRDSNGPGNMFLVDCLSRAHGEILQS